MVVSVFVACLLVGCRLGWQEAPHVEPQSAGAVFEPDSEHLIRLPERDRDRLSMLIGSRPPSGLTGESSWAMGDPIDLREVRGKVVVLQAWVGSSPKSGALLDALGDPESGVAGPECLVVGIDVGGNLRRCRTYLERRPLHATAVGVDHEERLARRIGEIPAGVNLVLDRQGAIRFVGLSEAGVREAVGALLQEPFDPDAPLAPLATNPTSPDDRSRAFRRRVEVAWQAGDEFGVDSAIRALWEIDADAARKASYAMLTGPRVAWRPTGATLLADLGTPEDIAAAARSLNAMTMIDERRWLVRSLGSKDIESAREPLVEFVNDTNRLIRASALQAFAELGDPRALSLFTRRMGTTPCERDTFDGDQESCERMAMHGAARALTGLRDPTPREIDEWLDAWDGAPVEPSFVDPVERSIVRGDWRGRAYYELPSFNLFFYVQGVDEPRASGDLSWPVLSDFTERAAGRARAAAEPIFGEMRLPVVRLLLADDRQFSAQAGQTFFGGVAKGNEIVLRLAPTNAMYATLVHEYVHIIHSAMYDDQPRWISEGLAESLSGSPAFSSWTAGAARQMGLEDAIRQGAVSEAVSWTSGGVSGPREAQRYALSYLVVDYLRFGPFASRNARLAFLMGRLSRGQSASQALRELYASPRELDEGLRRWIGMN